jgi:hypothetical protein
MNNLKGMGATYKDQMLFVLEEMAIQDSTQWRERDLLDQLREFRRGSGIEAGNSWIQAVNGSFNRQLALETTSELVGSDDDFQMVH